jgi:CheY-like chemotaxis protein
VEAKRILVAVRPRTNQIISDALASEFALTFCSSMTSAQLLLDESIDLIICGMHFDDGRMFDLLRYAKTNPKTRPIPFLCIKSNQGIVPIRAIKSVELASYVLGSDGFIEMYKWRRQFGDEEAYKKLRDIVRRLTSMAKC